jgi:hypothetical protein
MAPVRYALLSALALAADGSPITKWARRLSGPSDACKQACPNLEAFIASMDPADSQDGQDGGEQYTTTAAGEQYTTTDEDRRLSSGEGSIDMDGFGTQALEAMQSMCQYKDVIPCLQENSDVCDIPDNFTETSDHLTCICDLCPGIIEAQVGFMTVFVNAFAQGFSNDTAGSPPDQDDLEATMCMFSSCVQCAAEHPAQCAFMDMQGGMMNRRMTTMMDLMQMPNCPADATCSASASEVDSSKAGGMSSHLFVTSLLAVSVPMLVVAK